MSSRLRIGIIVAVVGVILIGLGAFTVYRLYTSSTGPGGSQIEPTPVAAVTVPVVVAVRDLPLGTLLTAEDITTKEIPVEFTTPETVSDVADAIDKVLKVDLVTGEMIMSHNLATPTAVIHDVAYVISETHVLIAFPASDLMSRESLVQRGDVVDIFATITTTLETENANGEITRQDTSFTIDSLQHLDITALVVDIITQDNTQAGEAGAEDSASRGNIIVQAYLLALDPQDALVIKYLKDTGAVFDFVIRAPTSTGTFNLTPVTEQYIQELYGLEILP